ncbi:MAG: NFACT family protein, partial [Lachnoclostridium sp.]|nr:NFACT family protein [Lachnoclostridium sp.]
MAFDGITIANIVKELNHVLTGGRIYKIAQPETDELLLTIKNNSSQYRLLLSADASLPLIYLTDKNKQSPMTAPGFCMLLRKHLQNARITDITQPGLERIVQIHVEHLNEMGDPCQKTLVIEIMGKHSNIIFCNADNMIIDSIKHISGMVSSVREVLPGREYFIPMTQEKLNPLSFIDEKSKQDFIQKLSAMPMPVYKALYNSFTGFSPIISQEICFRAGINADMPANALDSSSRERLYAVFCAVIEKITGGFFEPNIIYDTIHDKKSPLEFSSLPLTLYADKESVRFDTISEVLERYYAEKNTLTRIR